VKKCRYLLMPSVWSAADRFAAKRKAPTLEEFKGADNIILVKGDAKDKATLEPLLALLEKYDAEGPRMDAAHAAAKVRQAEQAAWEAVHPAPVEEMTVRFWPVQSAEYPTTVGK
jgi:hypothetical protein